MNIVKVEMKNRKASYSEGTIWTFFGSFYILAVVGSLKYCAINLENGKKLRNPESTPQKAVEGLAFYCKSANINIEPTE